jgi:hypothetical protein
MNNPNCPDPQYPEFDPATGDCFNITSVAEGFKEFQQQQNDTAPIFVGVFVLFALAAMLFKRKP